MQEISIVGISRGSEYSPNHVDNDAAIYNKVVEELRKLGCKVISYSKNILSPQNTSLLQKINTFALDTNFNPQRTRL